MLIDKDGINRRILNAPIIDLWEILVPTSNKKAKGYLYKSYSDKDHKKWDEFVKNISGGITIMRTAKGEWESPTGEQYMDRVIPVRMLCTVPQIKKIIDFTKKYYEQEVIMAYKVSNEIIMY